MTSRYSVGISQVPSAATLHSCARAIQSRANCSRGPSPREAYMVATGPNQVRNHSNNDSAS